MIIVRGSVLSTVLFFLYGFRVDATRSSSRSGGYLMMDTVHPVAGTFRSSVSPLPLYRLCPDGHYRKLWRLSSGLSILSQSGRKQCRASYLGLIADATYQVFDRILLAWLKHNIHFVHSFAYCWLKHNTLIHFVYPSFLIKNLSNRTRRNYGDSKRLQPPLNAIFRNDRRLC